MKAAQRGVALITVLLVLSLALLLVGGLLRGHRLLLQSAAQQVHQVQMRQWALSGEALARQLLAREAAHSRQPIHLGQPWAQRDLRLEVEGGEVQIAIKDLGGRFNLGALLVAGRPDGELARRWGRLLELQQLPAAGTAELLAIDLIDFSRTRLLPGFGKQHLLMLEPYVAVLPQRALLNLNTASAPVMASLGIPLHTARQLVVQRPAAGYEGVDRFLQDPLLARLDLTSHRLALNSDWFRVTVRVTLGDRELHWVSDLALDADQRRMRVVRRRVTTSEYSS